MTKKSLADALDESVALLREAAEQLDADFGRRLPADALVDAATRALSSNAEEYVLDPDTVWRFEQIASPPLPALRNPPSRYGVTVDAEVFAPRERVDIYPASWPTPEPGMGELTCLLELDGDAVYVEQLLHDHETGGALGRGLIAALVILPFLERHGAEASRVVFITTGLDDPIEVPLAEVAAFAEAARAP
ncbi:MAG: hypothetical protein H6713_28430 [Myxococcales bacterium]|nr:hypothetical protein [Myxococcales bacterium]MCB9753888.1 hypothetical protein [Myxococcales bacterium]